MKRIKAVLGKKWTYLLLLVALGWIFWLWILPYRYTAMALWGIAGTVGVYDLLARLGRKHPAPARRMRRLFTGCLCLILALMTVTGGLVLSGAGGAEDPACAYVVVLGAGVNGTQPSPSLEERLEAALAYLQPYPEAQCVVSGGQGGGENITEALCMYTWLTDRGIPPERIWQEERASSTQENLRFSLELIQEKTGSRPQELAVVSSEYHLYRASCMAQEEGVECLGVPAATYPLVLRLHYGFREIFGVWYFLLFGRSQHGRRT